MTGRVCQKVPRMSASAELIRHPATPCAAVRRIDAEVARPSAAVLFFRYRIEGDIASLRLPVAAPARRVDGLWQHSCFEAFLQADAGDGYCELNFSPAGDWAAYRFSGRRGGRSEPELASPRRTVRRAPRILAIDIELALERLPEIALAATLTAGLAAVIEERDGALSYWALAHGGDRPDFHDPATFTLRVPTP